MYPTADSATVQETPCLQGSQAQAGLIIWKPRCGGDISYGQARSLQHRAQACEPSSIGQDAAGSPDCRMVAHNMHTFQYAKV